MMGSSNSKARVVAANALRCLVEVERAIGQQQTIALVIIDHGRAITECPSDKSTLWRGQLAVKPSRQAKPSYDISRYNREHYIDEKNRVVKTMQGA